MPAPDDRLPPARSDGARPRGHVRAPARARPAVEMVERRVLCAAGSPAAFVPYAAAPALFQLTLGGEIGTDRDVDFFSLGRLRAGDVLSVTLGGAGSGRGTLADGALDLYRAGGNPAQPVLLTVNDDSGSGKDPLILRQLLSHDDEYFVRARPVSIGIGWTGSYTLALRLETSAPPAPPAAAAVPTAEAEPNDRVDLANRASGAWRRVAYASSQPGTIGTTPATAAADFAYELRAGDVVAVAIDSTSALDARVSLLGEGDADVLAFDAGEGVRGPGGPLDADVLAVRVPRGGVYRVRVQGNDQTSGAFVVNVYLSRDEPTVVGRYVFYNNSSLDGWSVAAGPADDAAIAAGKSALLPGRPATPSNVTNATAGITGMMLDVKGAPRALFQDDFEFSVGTPGQFGGWAAAPRPPSLSRRAGAGAAASDRYALVWPDGSIVNRWLRVTLKASPANGFLADDVFYFGNLVGETGDDPAAAAVTASDIVRVRAASGAAAPASDWFDFNKDGRVNALDQAAARANVSRSLQLTPVPSPAPDPLPGVAPATPRPRDPASRRLLYEVATGVLA